MTIAIRATVDGLCFGVRAVPGSSREGIRGRYGDRLRLAVQAPPEHGRANARICALLAELLAVPPRAVRITAGASGRDKQLCVTGLDEQELRRRLERLLG